MLAAANSFAQFSGLSARTLPGPRRTTTGVVSIARSPLVVEAKKVNRTEVRKNKHKRLRNKISGTPERPRLCVFRSNKHMYAQVVDDVAQCTLAHATTLQESVKTSLEGHANTVAAAEAVGKELARQCMEKGISKVCFDRAGYIYHGRVKAVADAAREGGLVF
uniref:Large ribosomal subunit protein uL18c n=1 Tax=Tetraselmis sp. GSL018 TaxID=582737 RepID=A0A061RYA2_9CHLO|mmetsp:Transcript_6151/g.14837  ORF Transcript_6151/g.14837 Transcript_6151/m.14837 type:complete len:163 (+) Transcript_6151:96-584(+)